MGRLVPSQDILTAATIKTPTNFVGGVLPHPLASVGQRLFFLFYPELLSFVIAHEGNLAMLVTRTYLGMHTSLPPGCPFICLCYARELVNPLERPPIKPPHTSVTHVSSLFSTRGADTRGVLLADPRYPSLHQNHNYACTPIATNEYSTTLFFVILVLRNLLRNAPILHVSSVILGLITNQHHSTGVFSTVPPSADVSAYTALSSTSTREHVRFQVCVIIISALFTTP